MQKKGAIDVSINFIITVIVSIVIFSLLLVLVHKWFFTSAEKKCELETKLQEEVEKTLVFGNSFLTISPVRKEVSGGPNFLNCENTIFTIGIKGFSGKGESNQYYLKFNCTGYYDFNSEEPDESICNEKYIITNKEFDNQGFIVFNDLQPGEVRKFSIIVNPNILRKKGVYAFKATLYKGGHERKDEVETKNFYVAVI